VTKKSKRSGCLLGSVGQYVGFPVVKNEIFFFFRRLYSFLPLVVVI